MAFDKSIDALFDGATSDGTDLTIPIAAITGLQAADVDATTGDWRELVFNLCNHINTYYYSLATADRPQYLIPQKSSNLQSGNTYIHTFITTVTATSTEENVVSET